MPSQSLIGDGKHHNACGIWGNFILLIINRKARRRKIIAFRVKIRHDKVPGIFKENSRILLHLTVGLPDYLLRQKCAIVLAGREETR